MRNISTRVKRREQGDYSSIDQVRGAQVIFSDIFGQICKRPRIDDTFYFTENGMEFCKGDTLLV